MKVPSDSYCDNVTKSLATILDTKHDCILQCKTSKRCTLNCTIWLR